MARAVVLAFSGGVAGLVAGGLAVDLANPGAPDMTIGVLLAAAYAGGIGSLVGTLLGVARGPFDVSARHAWVLRAGASAILALGVGIAPAAMTGSHPAIDELRMHSPFRMQLALLLAADAIIAAGTLLALSIRRTRKAT